ncbi:MAG: TrmH family RNA methyltransferase [Gemmatimonadales bacterium]|nr:MAG: TrmH family RNA methyltransferase [Gemmatimonadales bacterium]
MERVLALDGTVDPWSPKVVRASAASVFLLPVHRMELGEALDWLRIVRIPLLVADANGEDVRSIPVPESAALLMGNEGAGPRPAALAAAERVVALPMVAGAESLNVAVAGSILLWALGPGARST